LRLSSEALSYPLPISPNIITEHDDDDILEKIDAGSDLLLAHPHSLSLSLSHHHSHCHSLTSLTESRSFLSDTNLRRDPDGRHAAVSSSAATTMMRVISDRAHVSCHELSASDEILIMACDGLWDVISDLEAIKLAARSLFVFLESPAEAAFRLKTYAYTNGSTDNITVIVVLLPAGREKWLRARQKRKDLRHERKRLRKEGEGQQNTSPTRCSARRRELVKCVSPLRAECPLNDIKEEGKTRTPKSSSQTPNLNESDQEENLAATKSEEFSHSVPSARLQDCAQFPRNESL
jgi:hypothetical protein